MNSYVWSYDKFASEPGVPRNPPPYLVTHVPFSRPLGRNQLFSVGIVGTGNCALVSHFRRDVCAHAGGAWGGDPQTGYGLFMSPSEFLCSSNGTQRPLSAAVNHSPTSQIWVCWIQTRWTWVHTRPLPLPEDKKPGVGCNLESTIDTKSSSTP